MLTELQFANAVCVSLIGAWAFWRLSKTSAGEWSIGLAALALLASCIFWLFDRVILANQWRVDTVLVHAAVVVCLWLGVLRHAAFDRRLRGRRFSDALEAFRKTLS